MSLLINHQDLLCGGRGQGAALGGCVSDWPTDGVVGACPRVWADEGEGERKAAG